VQARRVLQKFVRVAPVWNLHCGTRLIETTAEHPFFAEDKGWTPTTMLEIGDRIRLERDGWVRVDGVADSGRVETVYNLEVEDEHTYFVGGEEWGFAVWAHNARYNTNKMGRIGEASIKDYLLQKGWVVIHTLSRGRNGIDIIAQKTLSNGKTVTRIFEAKVGSSRLSKLQQLGAEGYAKNVLGRFKNPSQLSAGANSARILLQDMIRNGEKIGGAVIRIRWDRGLVELFVKPWNKRP
jgi:hypothetical protein